MVDEQGDVIMGKRNFLDRLFPPRYDFYGMLSEQAAITAQGVSTLLAWLEDPAPENYARLIKLAVQADKVRMDMEEKLIEAFTTPFDRQDIYHLSVQMDRIIEYSRTTMQSIKEYEVTVDHFIIAMVRELAAGTVTLARAVALLGQRPIDVKCQIQIIRLSLDAVEENYRRGMAAAFKKSDVMGAIKYHDVKCQIRDAAYFLRYSADILHRIVVRLV